MPQLDERADVLERKSPLRAGLRLLGRYELVSFLARGGMGVVWTARHLQLGSRVAIKFAAATDAGTRRRFLTEARSAAAIQSPHVVRVYDVGEWQEVPFLVMELLEGETLAEHLKTMGRLEASEALSVLRQIASALECAHEWGVVHGDLKPSNIFLTGDRGKRIAKILDFGVARNLRDAAHERLGSGGTLRYASPEQIRADSPLSPAADVWALGIVAFECFRGASPYGRRSSLEILAQVGKWSFDSNRCHAEAGPGFEPWFRTATALEPSARFDSPKRAIDELTHALGLAEIEPEARRKFSPSPQLEAPATAPTLSIDFAGGESGERQETGEWSSARRGSTLQRRLGWGAVASVVLFVGLFVFLRGSSSPVRSSVERRPTSSRTVTTVEGLARAPAVESASSPRAESPRPRAEMAPTSAEVRVEEKKASRFKKPRLPKPERTEPISLTEGEGAVWEYRD